MFAMRAHRWVGKFALALIVAVAAGGCKGGPGHDSAVVGTWKSAGASASDAPSQGFRLESGGTGTCVSVGAGGVTDTGPNIAWSTDDTILNFQLANQTRSGSGDSFTYKVSSDGKTLTVDPPISGMGGTFTKV